MAICPDMREGVGDRSLEEFLGASGEGLVRGQTPVESFERREESAMPASHARGGELCQKCLPSASATPNRTDRPCAPESRRACGSFGAARKAANSGGAPRMAFPPR